MTIVIRPECPADFPAVADVHRLAFAREAEARLVDALRDGAHARVSLVAQRQGQIVGHVLFSELTIHTPAGGRTALALAPLAVLPACQRQGIGSQLVQQGLIECRRQGHQAVIVLGDPAYYGRFGFSVAASRRLESPYACEAWLAVELVENALEKIAGKVEYPAPFVDV